MSKLCDPAKMQTLVEAMRVDDNQIARVDTLLAEYPEDPRLHFLRGSMLVGAKRLIEAHSALSRAVSLAPDFAIARFQLGFFQLTSGEADNALSTWGPLDRLEDGHYLRKFVEGLRCLIRDDFAGAVQWLRDGIAHNGENPPLNRDMELLITKCAELTADREHDDGSEPASETSLILNQFNNRQRPN